MKRLILNVAIGIEFCFPALPFISFNIRCIMYFSNFVGISAGD